MILPNLLGALLGLGLLELVERVQSGIEDRKRQKLWEAGEPGRKRALDDYSSFIQSTCGKPAVHRRRR